MSYGRGGAKMYHRGKPWPVEGCVCFYKVWPCYIILFRSSAPFCYRPLPLPRALLASWHEHNTHLYTHTHTHTHTHLTSTPCCCRCKLYGAAATRQEAFSLSWASGSPPASSSSSSAQSSKEEWRPSSWQQSSQNVYFWQYFTLKSPTCKKLFV